MSLNPEWTMTCRICLREGDIRSLFDVCPVYNLTYCAKVMQCTAVEIRRNDTLPEQICVQCIGDLNVAYKFRINCESSDAILQSYRQSAWKRNGREPPDVCQGEESCSSSEIQIPISSDVVYSYKPPSGLNVKLVSKEQSVLLENNGEIVICGPPMDQKSNSRDEYDTTFVQRSPEGQEAEDDEDNDSLITFDDVLPPSTSQLEDDEEQVVDKETDDRTDIIDLVGDDTRNEDSEQQSGDIDAEIYFDTEFVYVRQKNAVQDPTESDTAQDDMSRWEVIVSSSENIGWELLYQNVFFSSMMTLTVTNTRKRSRSPKHLIVFLSLQQMYK